MCAGAYVCFVICQFGSSTTLSPVGVSNGRRFFLFLFMCVLFLFVFLSVFDFRTNRKRNSLPPPTVFSQPIPAECFLSIIFVTSVCLCVTPICAETQAGRRERERESDRGREGSSSSGAHLPNSRCLIAALPHRRPSAPDRTGPDRAVLYSCFFSFFLQYSSSYCLDRTGRTTNFLFCFEHTASL